MTGNTHAFGRSSQKGNLVEAMLWCRQDRFLTKAGQGGQFNGVRKTGSVEVRAHRTLPIAL